MKKIFVIDRTLLVAFLLSAVSGIAFHLVGHSASHELWRRWAVCHVLTSTAFLITVSLHIKTHWGWYKSWVKRGQGKKSRVTVLLTCLFTLTALTGIGLLFVRGANSFLGLWHYRLGLAVLVISIGHILKRHHLLAKALKPE